MSAFLSSWSLTSRTLRLRVVVVVFEPACRISTDMERARATRCRKRGSYHCVYLGVLDCGGGETKMRDRDSRFIGCTSIDRVTIRGLVVQLLVVVYI